jgi:hypothetical protein
VDRPPTRTETVLGAVLIVGALALGARWVVRRAAAPEQAPNPCADAAAGRQRIADREFDLAQGIRTGSMSAAEVREATAALEQRRAYTARDEAECATLKP